MNKRSVWVAVALSVALMAGVSSVGVWRLYRHTPAPPQAVLLRDRSDSSSEGCGDMGAMMREIIAGSQFGKGSTISVMVTGDDSTSGEPVLIGDFEVPIMQKVTEGRGKVLQQQQALLDEVVRRCREAGQTNRSPIYMAIRRAVEYMRARGCDGRGNCTLYVQSDLEELSEKKIKDLLNSPQSPNRKVAEATPTLPSPIDNSGIAIKVCGISETAGATNSEQGRKKILTPSRDAQRADRIQAVWEKLFTAPQNVTFNPLCPKS